MLFVVIMLVVVGLIVYAVVRANAAKRRTITQALQGGVAGQMQMLQQRGIKITVHPPTVTNTENMSGFAQDILASMGGAEGILNRPEVRDALRNAAQHPGVTTTVTSSIGSENTAGTSPFDTPSNPFAQSSSPFASTQPAATNALPTVQTGAGGEMGVAEVVSAPTTTFDGTRELSLELDAIGAPKRRVAATLTGDQTDNLAVGSRIYVRLDPRDSSRVILLPTNHGNNVLPEGSNRLDPIVLGPQIFKNGAHGKAIVKSATKVEDTGGGGTWHLELEVTPERGWPYRAELKTTVSTPEKAARVCVVGAEVPVLYDPDDPKTMCVDSVALGYGNPFAG